jgi:hypothetical protein
MNRCTIRPWSIGSEVANVLDPALLGLPGATHFQLSVAELIPRLLASNDAFRYFREEIQGSLSHQILEDEREADFEANEDDRNEMKLCPIPSFCSGLLIKCCMN